MKLHYAAASSPPRHAALLLAVFVLPVLSTTATAQSRAIPGQSYFGAIDLLYRGDYRRAERAFNNELRGAVKTATSRWIDSVCFHAMLGETRYVQGRYAEALADFDSACQMFLAFPDFMTSAQFQPLRPEGARARRLAPWARTSRQVTYAALPPTQLIQIGGVQVIPAGDSQIQISNAQLWRLNVAEVIRTTALAIRRRTELLGPLSEHDPLTRRMEERLSRGGLAPAASWSNAWIELLTGVAKVSVNKPKEAAAHLARAARLEGRYDHPLTGVAMLAQAELARAAGNAAAASLFVEAGLAAFAYEDFEAIDRALWHGHVHHLTAGGQGVYPLLDGAIAWADRQRFEPFALRYRQAKAEALLGAGQAQPAAALISGRPRNRDLTSGPLPTRTQFLLAQSRYASGQPSEAGETLDRAFSQQPASSLLGFQTQLVNARFDGGAMSARIAVQVYDRLLSDPTPADWAADPHDVLSHLKTSREPAMARWFAAHLGRREVDKAVRVADLAKRRRFFSELPMGGRLVALRRLLDPAPGAAPLTKQQQAERQAWLLAHPGYTATLQAIAPHRRTIDDAAALLDGDRIAKQVGVALTQLDRLGLEQEQTLRALALDRRASSLAFPPAVTLDEVKKQLRYGDAVLLFHQAADSMNGFLIAASGEHYWRLPNTRSLKGQVAKLLNALGATNSQSNLSIETASSDAWRNAARDFGELLLKDSRLDLSQTKRLVIVPDGALWHVPFEVLIPPGEEEPLIDIVPIRYAPTLGLAAPNKQPLRPIRRAAIAISKRSASDRDGTAMQDAKRLADAASLDGVTAEPLLTPLGTPAAATVAAFDLLVVNAESQIDPANPFAWRPAPLDRKGGALAQWLRLGGRAPQRLALGGVHTAAENGLKGSRSSRRSGNSPPRPDGWEVFHATCGLLASGTRTALVSRWATGGQVGQSLLREFASEVPHVPAPDAWRRSVALARETRLEPDVEPRFDATLDDEPPLATHPFFWSGYLLLDTSFDPLDAAPQDEVAVE